MCFIVVLSVYHSQKTICIKLFPIILSKVFLFALFVLLLVDVFNLARLLLHLRTTSCIVRIT